MQNNEEDFTKERPSFPPPPPPKSAPPPLPPPRRSTGLLQNKVGQKTDFDEFFDAVGKGDAQEVCNILADNKTPELLINGSKVFGITPLMQAVQFGHVAVTKLLLENGAELEQQNGYEQTALAVAIKSDKADIVELLLHYNAQYTLRDPTCVLIAENAYILGTPELKEIFAKQQPNSQKSHSFKSYLPLYSSFNAAANYTTRNFTTMLHGNLSQAAAKGDLQLIKKLINSGGDINQGKPLPPLIAAIEAKQLDAVKLLLKLGANPNCEYEDTLKKNALLLAIENSQPKMVYELAKYGAKFTLHEPDQVSIVECDCYYQSIAADILHELKEGVAFYAASSRKTIK